MRIKDEFMTSLDWEIIHLSDKLLTLLRCYEKERYSCNGKIALIKKLEFGKAMIIERALDRAEEQRKISDPNISGDERKKFQKRKQDGKKADKSRELIRDTLHVIFLNLSKIYLT